jgi:thiamine pyrophosphokinase
VGDLDSIGAEHLPGHVVIERHPRDKDQTDLDLALELAMRDEPHRVVVVGGSGGRLDHELATASLICDERWSDVEMDWVSSRGRAHVIRRHRTVHGDVGATVSLLAVGGPVTGLTTRGLRWELNGARFEPGSTWGVSNVMQAPVADIRIGSGCLLVVFPE